MKIQIETPITDCNINELNELIQICLSAKSLADLNSAMADNDLDGKFFTLAYGFGSNHMWVKEITSANKLSEKRLLFVTT